MNEPRMTYEMDDKPGPLPLFLYGLQWWVVAVPSTIILGLVTARLHFEGDLGSQVAYLQKLLCLTGVAMAGQALFGHRLPAVTGPASVLLVGVMASLSAGLSAIYSAIMISGIAVALLGVTGLMRYMQRIFTPRILIAITLLIPFTLIPTIRTLLFYKGDPFFNFVFALALSAFMVTLNQLFRGVWKATTLMWGLAVGTAVFYYLKGFPPIWQGGGESFFDPKRWFVGFSFDPGVTLAFLICSVVLVMNEVGSIETIGQMLGADNMPQRNRRGIVVTGLANMAAGLTGVIGTVDYISSTGIISATRCASRYPFLPAAALMVLASFFSGLIAFLVAMPGIIMGPVLLYVMASQMTAGLQMLVRKQAITDFYQGMTLAIPLMLAVTVSFLPSSATEAFPILVRPMLANGFVVGVFAALFMEHLLARLAPESKQG